MVLGSHTYTLRTGLIIPSNTTILGTGRNVAANVGSAIEFSIVAPKAAKVQCGASQPGLDFFKKDCDPTKEHCFRDVAEFDNTTASLQDCCEKCKANAQCNGYTHEYSPPRGYLCLLKGCSTDTSWAYDCATSTGGANNTCAYVKRAVGPGSMAKNAITVGSDVQLLNFSLTLTPQTTVPMMPAIYMPTGVQRFRAIGLDIDMQQQNVSNAFKLWGTQLEIGNNIVHQTGTCIWPGYGPKSDATPFQPSTAM